MNGFWLLVIFVVCVMGWRGWHLGLRQVLIQVLSSLLAIVCSTIVTPLLVRGLDGLISPSLVWVAGGVVLFVTVLVFANRILTLALEPLKLTPVVAKISGLLVNGIVGILFSGALIWSLGVMSAIWNLNRGLPISSVQTLPEMLAGLEMGYLVKLSALASGIRPLEANMAGMIAENPPAFMGDIQQLALSPELMEILRNPEAQTLMREKNLSHLRQHNVIAKFLALPAAQDLGSRITLAGYPQGDDLLMEHFANTWRGYDALLHDDEVQGLLLQGKLVEQASNGDQLGMLLNPAFPKLLGRLTVLMEAGTMATASSPNNAIVYRWQSEDLAVHFSPWADVPLKFRATAIPVKQP